MIRLKEDQQLNDEQSKKFKQTLVHLNGVQKKKSKKKSYSFKGKLTPSYKIAKAYKNRG